MLRAAAESRASTPKQVKSKPPSLIAAEVQHLSVSAAKKEVIRTIEYVEQHVLYITPEPSRAESLRILDAAIIAFDSIGTKCPNREIRRFVTKSVRICHGLTNFISLPRQKLKRLSVCRRAA